MMSKLVIVCFAVLVVVGVSRPLVDDEETDVNAIGLNFGLEEKLSGKDIGQQFGLEDGTYNLKSLFL